MFDHTAHDVVCRESDGELVCRRCGLINPGDEGVLCVLLPDWDPATEYSEAA